jgi:hypothetical protein
MTAARQTPDVYEMGERTANLIVQTLSDEITVLRRSIASLPGPARARDRKSLRDRIDDMDRVICAINTGEGATRASAAAQLCAAATVS